MKRRRRPAYVAAVEAAGHTLAVCRWPTPTVHILPPPTAEILAGLGCVPEADVVRFLNRREGEALMATLGPVGPDAAA